MYGRGFRTFCSGIPAAKNILPLTIPSYHLTDTLARYNNAGWVSRNALHTYYFASFFRRARAAKTIGFYVRKPWARGAVLLKIHSSPLPSMAEVASGNLHLIPGGSLCHQVAGSHHWQLARSGKRGGKLEPRDAAVSQQDTTSRSVCRTKKRFYTQLHAAFN